MGKAPASWTSHENEALATAWINTSEDKDSTKVKGTNQTKETFFASVIEKLETIALESGEDVKERYHNRKHTALFNHWSENVARECKKFNKALLKVISSKPTGVNESDMVNMAAAVHLLSTSFINKHAPHGDSENEDFPRMFEDLRFLAKMSRPLL